MDKIDWIIISIVISIMVVCFSLGTKWSYFCAGICATCILTVLVGRIGYLSGQKNTERQWENFIDTFDTAHPVGSAITETAA